jgi:hypothetical protein
MISIALAKNLLCSAAQETVANSGFSKVRELTFQRSKNEVDGFIMLGLRRDPRGFWATSCSLGLGFRRLDKFLEDGSEHSQIHVNFPLHMALGLIEFREWKFASEEDFVALADDIKLSLLDASLFINEKSELGVVIKDLQVPDPRRWYGLAPDRKDLVLAAALAADKQKESALALVDASIERYKNGPAKRFTAFVALRERL